MLPDDDELTGTAPGASYYVPPQPIAPSDPTPVQPGLLQPGALIGADRRYRVVELIGRGGFGETYLAHDTHLFDAPCVVKCLLLSDDDPQRNYRMASLASEARLLVDLKTPGHPHIPEVYAYLSDEHCLVMKYIEGRTLRALLRSPDGPAPDDVLRYAQSVCSALVYMHGRGVMHLDIKPENLLLDSADRLWVIDFGIGRSTASPDDAASIGTPGYTPPEQWQRRPVPRSDIYALAATMWALLTRRSPLDRNNIALNSQGSAQIPPELRRLIDAGLANAPGDRPTAQEFLAELEALIAPEPLAAPPQAWPLPLPHDPVGRSAELADHEARLRSDHFALLSGLAGVGKTTLGAMLARRHLEPARVFWHRFRPGEGGDIVIWQLAAFLSGQGFGELWRLIQRAHRESAQAPPAELLCDYAVQALRDRSFLVCLDDVELVEDEPLVARLITGLRESWRAGGGLLVIARHVPTFLRDIESPALGGLRRTDAQELLAAQRVALDPALADRLYASTEGNAQLLILAANALRRAAHPGLLIDRLTASDDIERFLLEQVDDRLSDEERSLLQAASALLGYSGDRDALVAAQGRSLNRRTLQNLLRRHLLTASEGGAGQEYTLHAILRAFYYEDLSPEERRAMHLRLAAHYEGAGRDVLLAAHHYARAGEAERAATLATADVWRLINAAQARPLATLLEELSAAALGDASRVALSLARGDVLTLFREGAEAQAAYAEAHTLLERWPPGLRRAALRAHACRGLAAALEYESPDEALRWLLRGLDELPPAGAEDEGLAQERARLQHRLGSVLLAQGQAEQAEAPLAAALATMPAGLDSLRADLLVNLGVARCEQGDVAEGEARFREALATYSGQANLWGMAAALQNLAMVADYGGDWPAATRAYSEALDLAERIGDVNRQASLRLNIGNLAMPQGDFERSRIELSSAMELAERHGLREYIVATGASLVELYLRTDARGLAAEALAAASAAAAALETVDQLPELLRGRAALALVDDDPESAAALAARALDLAGGDPRDEGLALRLRGQAALARGNHPAALEDFAASAVALEPADPYEAARTQAVWGQALIAQGSTAEGAALLRGAGDAFAQLGALHDLRELRRGGLD